MVITMVAKFLESMDKYFIPEDGFSFQDKTLMCFAVCWFIFWPLYLIYKMGERSAQREIDLDMRCLYNFLYPDKKRHPQNTLNLLAVYFPRKWFLPYIKRGEK